MARWQMETVLRRMAALLDEGKRTELVILRPDEDF